MSTLWKMAWCVCGKCRQKHRDVVHLTQPTEDGNGEPVLIKQVCDKCLMSRMTGGARAAYKAYKENVVRHLEKP